MIRAPVMLTAAALALQLAACVGPGGAIPSPSTKPEETSLSTLMPEPSPMPSPSAPSPAAASSSPDAAIDEEGLTFRPGDGPPDLLLSVDGASPAVGEAGSSCWSSSAGTGCADVPWLVPETPIEVESGALLRVEVGAPYPLAGWDVVAEAADVPADGEPALRLANRQPGAAVPPSPIVLEALPAGDWVVAASVWFERGGDVTSYWRVQVR